MLPDPVGLGRAARRSRVRGLDRGAAGAALRPRASGSRSPTTGRCWRRARRHRPGSPAVVHALRRAAARRRGAVDHAAVRGRAARRQDVRARRLRRQGRRHRAAAGAGGVGRDARRPPPPFTVIFSPTRPRRSAARAWTRRSPPTPTACTPTRACGRASCATTTAARGSASAAAATSRSTSSSRLLDADQHTAFALDPALGAAAS